MKIIKKQFIKHDLNFIMFVIYPWKLLGSELTELVFKQLQVFCEVELSDNDVYLMKAYQELEGTFELEGCIK